MRCGYLVVLCAGVLYGCAPVSSPSPEAPQSDLPQQELYDATITFFNNDRVSSVLRAGRIRKFQKQALVLLDSGVVVDFFDAEGRHTTTLWADSGRTDEHRRDMVAYGRVIARSDSGETLETSSLRWDNRARQIRSDARVKLSTPTDTIFGLGFVSDEHLKNWRIDQPFGRTFRELEKRVRHDSSAAQAESGRTGQELRP